MWRWSIPTQSAIGRALAVGLVYGNVLALFTFALISIIFCLSLTEEVLEDMENQVKRMEEAVVAARLELSNVQEEIRELILQSKNSS